MLDGKDEAGLRARTKSLDEAGELDSAHQRKSWGYVMRSLLAGAAAGGLAKTATAPLDRVKILFQGSHTSFTRERGSVVGAFTAMRRIAASDGLRGLYKGHLAMLARILPYAAMNYMCFEQFKEVLVPDGQPLFPLARLVAGAMAGACSVAVTYPLDLTRSRLAFQVLGNRYRGINHLLVTMYREEGFLSLYRGFVPTLMGILPYAGLSFYTYDTAKLLCRKHIPELAVCPDGSLHTPFHLACGAVAGAVAQTASYPLDVVRRRMQLKGLARNVPSYRGMSDAFRVIWATEGIRGLFVGLSLNYVKVVPAVSVSFATYEAIKEYLGIATHRYNGSSS